MKRRGFFQWIAGLFAAPAAIKAVGLTEQSFAHGPWMLPVQPPPHDGCFRCVTNLRVDGDPTYARHIAEILSVENDVLLPTRMGKGKTHEVRASDGTITSDSSIVIHERIPIGIFLSTLDENDRAVLRSQLTAQSQGFTNFKYNPCGGWLGYANGRSDHDATLRIINAFLWPHIEADKIACCTARINGLKSIGGHKAFERRHMNSDVCPGYESFWQGERKISAIVADMTLRDRRATLAAL